MIEEDEAISTTFSDNDLRLALDKAAKQTEVAVLPLSSGLAKTHHLNALRLILEHLPKEDWVELRQPTQLAPGDVYMVTGPGWEVISQVPAEPILESTAAWHPRTGVRLRFGDILSNIASGVSLYQLSKDSTND